MDAFTLTLMMSWFVFVWVVIPFRSYVKPGAEQINIFIDEFRVDTGYPAAIMERLVTKGYNVTRLESGDLYLENRSFLTGHYGLISFTEDRARVLFLNKIMFDAYRKVKIKWFRYDVSPENLPPANMMIS